VSGWLSGRVPSTSHDRASRCSCAIGGPRRVRWSPVARRRRHNSGICHQFARTSARSRGSRHVGVLHRGIRLTHVQAPTSPEMDRWLVALLVLWKAEERSSQADRWAGGLHLQRVRRPLRRDPREGAAGKVMLIARPHGRDTVRWLIHLEQSSHLRLSEAWRCCQTARYRTHRNIRYSAESDVGQLHLALPLSRPGV